MVVARVDEGPAFAIRVEMPSTGAGVKNAASFATTR